MTAGNKSASQEKKEGSTYPDSSALPEKGTTCIPSQHRHEKTLPDTVYDRVFIGRNTIPAHTFGN
jgi:hypothetical protein